MSSVLENLNQVKASIRAAGIDPQKVTVLGVTKKQSAEKVQEGIEAGLTCLGGNYVQETLDLQTAVSGKAQWHYIGQIQSRKVKLLTAFECIQSLDRLDIAEKLNGLGKKFSVLVQVNIGDEETKGGVNPEEVKSFCAELKKFTNLSVSGLMALPPPLEPVEARAPYFKKMRELYDALGQEFPFRWLSMGTSEDYLVALKEGANMIRLGNILFGSRRI